LFCFSLGAKVMDSWHYYNHLEVTEFGVTSRIVPRFDIQEPDMQQSVWSLTIYTAVTISYLWMFVDGRVVTTSAARGVWEWILHLLPDSQVSVS
jgi:hypothetical protein